MFTIKMDPGVVAKSFQEEDLVYISVDKLLPLSRFTNRKLLGGYDGDDVYHFDVQTVHIFLVHN